MPYEIPEPRYDAEDAPLPEGETVVLPAPTGPAVRLSFPSAYEPFLTLDGARITGDRGPAHRDLLLWLSRRMPALSRALEPRLALLGVLSGSTVLVHDLVQIDDGGFLDHGNTRARLEGARVALPGYALLGSVGSKAELMSRVRGMFAAGTTIEVRSEDAGRVISRRRARVGR